MGSLSEFYPTFKEEIIPILTISFLGRNKGQNSSQLILLISGQHYPDTKINNGIIRKENYRPIFLKNTGAKIPKKILANQIQKV